MQKTTRAIQTTFLGFLILGASMNALGQDAALAGAASATGAGSLAEMTPEQKLLRTRRIFVESFGDEPYSRQVQAMVIDALMKTNKFVVTESRERADAILKGTGLENRSQELHAISESGSVATAVVSSSSTHDASSSGSVSGRVADGTGSISGSSSGSAHGRSSTFGHAQDVGVDDSQASTETIDDARLTVRLVDRDGDVIWSTVQESKGGKYKGATADAADKIAKQLLRDLERINRAAQPAPKP